MLPRFTFIPLFLLLMCVPLLNSYELRFTNLNDLVSNITTYRYKGRWSLKSAEKKFYQSVLKFSEKKGTASISFSYDSEAKTFSSEIQVFNGNYEDDSNVHFNCSNGPTANFSNHNLIYTFPEDQIFAAVRDKYYQVTHKITPISNRIAIEFNFANLFINNSSKASGSGSGAIEIKIKVFPETDSTSDPLDPNGNPITEFHLVFTRDKEGKAAYIVYFVLISVVGLVKILGLFKMTTECHDDEYQAKKISAISQIMLIAWDYCIINYCQPTFHKFFYVWSTLLTVSCFFVLVSDILFVVILLHLKYKEELSDGRKLLRRVSYLIGAVCFVSMSPSLFYLFDYFKLFLGLALVPQIVSNCQQRDLVPYRGIFKILACCAPFGIIFYYKIYENNLMGYRPYLSFSIMLGTMLGIQILILIIQIICGPLICVPKKYLKYFPNEMDFLRNLKTTITDDNTEEGNECPICLNHLSHTDPRFGTKDAAIIYRSLQFKKGDILKTPCGHKFHAHCLLQSLLIKKVCPICRGRVVPSEDSGEM